MFCGVDFEPGLSLLLEPKWLSSQALTADGSIIVHERMKLAVSYQVTLVRRRFVNWEFIVVVRRTFVN